MGYGDVVATTTHERLYSIVAQVIGAVTFTYSVTRIVHTLATMGRSRRHLTAQLETLGEWAMHHSFPQKMVNDIRSYLHYKSSQAYYEENAIIQGLSVSLRRDILRHIFNSTMQQVELFQHLQFSDAFLSELMLALRPEFAAPFCVLIKQGSIGDAMYSIRKGYAAAYRGKTRKDVQSAVILGPGQEFGEVSLLTDNLTRTASIVSLEWIDLCVIKRAEFRELISHFPKEQHKLDIYAQQKIKNWILIRQREKRKQSERNRHVNSTSASASASREAASETTDTKSVSADLRKYRISIDQLAHQRDSPESPRQQDDDLSGLVIIDDTTPREHIRKQRRKRERKANDPRQRIDSLNRELDKKEFKDAVLRMQTQHPIELFPKNAILRRLDALKKHLKNVETHWGSNLEDLEFWNQHFQEQASSAEFEEEKKERIRKER